jgi:hypothetical protein
VRAGRRRMPLGRLANGPTLKACGPCLRRNESKECTQKYDMCSWYTQSYCAPSISSSKFCTCQRTPEPHGTPMPASRALAATVVCSPCDAPAEPQRHRRAPRQNHCARLCATLSAAYGPLGRAAARRGPNSAFGCHGVEGSGVCLTDEDAIVVQHVHHTSHHVLHVINLRRQQPSPR